MTNRHSLHWLLALLLALAVILGLTTCGGGGDEPTGALPSIAIVNPTDADTYDTTRSGVIIGGTVSGASFVHVVNTTTGFRTEGYVNYFEGHGSWFADVPGLVPGANVIVATADADGSGTRTASDTLAVVRPLQPASLILNGADPASATSYWVDANSVGKSHQIALYADGSGRSTTGNVLTETAGPPVTMAWAYDGPEAIVVNGCPTCSYQRISRIAGSTAESLFYGTIETVGGATETHGFNLMAGSF
jgi:hypothetical protein